MRMGWCQAARIRSCHVFSVWRRKRWQRNQWEDRSGWRRTRPQRGFGFSRRQCEKYSKQKKALNQLTQSRTPCGRGGTYCSLGQKRRGRRRSRWQTWISTGTVYGPPCLRGRPKKRLQTSSPDTQCCLDRGKGRRIWIITIIWSLTLMNAVKSYNSQVRLICTIKNLTHNN